MASRALYYCILTAIFTFSTSAWANKILYDPIPVCNGTGDLNYILAKTYIAGENLTGENNTVEATEGAYVAGWQWPANWSTTTDGLNYTDGDLQLITSGGSLKKLLGTTSFRNYTLRKFSGASESIIYFSFLIRFNDFGDGVDTRIGLGNLSSKLNMTAFLSVSNTGIAKAVMHDIASDDSMQLHTRHTYLVVGKLDYNVTDQASNTSERLTIWVEPQLDLDDEPAEDRADQFAGRLQATSNAMDVISDYIGARSSENAPVDVTVDEYRIATTWPEVTPTAPALLLYDPAPIGGGPSDSSYIPDQNLSGANSNVNAILGSYAGPWQRGENFSISTRGLDYIYGTKKLATSVGAFKKNTGDSAYQSSTTRSFEGALSQTTYFSGLIKWAHFGNGVDTQFGLANSNNFTGMIACLSVDSLGMARSCLYDSFSTNAGQLETGVTYLIVGRLEYDISSTDSERLTLWIQPNLNRDISPEPGDTSDFLYQFQVTANGSNLANHIGIRGDGADPVDFLIDECRVGWTYAAVIPTNDYYCVTEQWVTANLPPLAQPLGTHLPVIIWGNPIQYDISDNNYIVNLYQRGLCYTPNITSDRTPDAASKMSVLASIGGARPIIMQSCGQWAFGDTPHDYLEDDSSHDHPCLGFFQEKLAAEVNRTTNFMGDLASLEMSPNLFLFDWENWCRWKYYIDDPNNDAALTDKRSYAMTCGRCITNLPSSDLASNQSYLNAVETRRALVLKEGLYGPVKSAFPGAWVGNYWTTSFVRSDQPLGDVHRAVGWHGSDAEISMFVGYGNRYDKMKSSEFVGWNMFRYFLHRYTEETRESVGNEIQIPWTCRLLPSDAMEDENGVKHQIYTLNGDPIPLYAWPRDSYREYLRHCMLRGAKTFAIFYPQFDSSTYAQSLGYQRELSDVLQVINEMHAYDDVLDTGTILNMGNLPGDYDDDTNAVVWSGVATADKAVIRAVSFTGAPAVISVPVFGRIENINATVDGTTTIINR